MNPAGPSCVSLGMHLTTTPRHPFPRPGRRRRWLAVAAAATTVAAGGLLLHGNGSGADEPAAPRGPAADGVAVDIDRGAAAPDAPAAPTAPRPPATEGGDDGPAAPAPAPSAPALEDGRHFGYLVGYELDGGGTVAAFDLAQLLTGDDADRAAADDGVIRPGDQVENDVYIRNVNRRLRHVVLADHAAISVVDCASGCHGVRADLAALRSRPTPTPAWLTVVDGVVTGIEEQYLP